MEPRRRVSLAVEARRLRIISVAADWASTSVAWLIFDVVRFRLVGSGYASLDRFLLAPTVMAGQILFPLAMIGVYWLSGYYNEPLNRSRLSELGLTVGSALAGTMAVLLLMLLNDLTPALADDYLLLGTLFGLLSVLVYLPRVIISGQTLRRFRRGYLVWRAAVVGDEEHGSGEPAGKLPAHANIEPVMTCSASEALAAADEGMVDCFFLLPAPSGRMEDLMSDLAILLAANKPVYFAPNHENLVERRYGRRDNGCSGRNAISAVTEEPLIDLSRTEMPAMTMNVKRMSDIVLGSSALVITAPLVVALAAAVKLTSPGPAFYRQRRVGRHRRPFDIIKLRTMRADAEDDGAPRLTSVDDPRVTKLGRVMRRYRLDELPQFVNVIKGEMSLVGPRPERPHFVDKIVDRAPFYTLVHQIRPGITSWGMVKYGYASTVEEMVERMRYDLLYLENVSFAVDMKIIIHTIRTIASGKGL